MQQFFPMLYGNEKAKNRIGRDIRDKKHHHAYILEGPIGSGRHVMAVEMAKALLCSETEGNVFPCGVCSHCKKINAGFCTDILFVNSGDKATFSVEVVREALATLSYAPDEGNYKIYIFEDCEKMTLQAQNALLLSLEEPPSYAVFILLVTDAATLLETIRSRTAIFAMELFSRDAVYTYLQQNCAPVSEHKTLDAASLSGGVIGAAKAVLAGENSAEELSAAAGNFVSILCTGTAADALVYCSQMKYTRQQFDTFLICAMTAVRDHIAMKTGGQDLLFYPDRSGVPDSAGNTIGRLTALYDALYKAREEIVHANASPYPVLCTTTEKHFYQD